MSQQEHILCARGLRKTYGDLEVLKGIDFSLSPQEMTTGKGVFEF